MGNRKHSIIDSLPATLKDTVEQMMQENFTYAEIADFIKQNGYEISTTSVWRYASNLNASIQQLKMAQENFRVIMDEIGKYPDAGFESVKTMVFEAMAKENPELYAQVVKFLESKREIKKEEL